MDELKYDCPICLDKFEYNNIILLSCCGNKFHLDCLLEWIKDNKTCPICRNEENINERIKPLFVTIENEPLLGSNVNTTEEENIIYKHYIICIRNTFTIIGMIFILGTIIMNGRHHISL